MSDTSLDQLKAISDALQHVVDPCSIATGTPVSLPDMGMIKQIDLSGERVRITLRPTSALCLQIGNIVDAVEHRVSQIPGIASVACMVDTSGDWSPEMMAVKARRKRSVD
jgi:metal-sulfur cluster biosynthetic enzyme